MYSQKTLPTSEADSNLCPHAVPDMSPAMLPCIKLPPSLALCSDLLDEEADPLEVLPNSTINGPLFLLFRVLYADWDSFKSWGDLDGGHLLCAGAVCCCCRLCNAAVIRRGSYCA